MKVLLVRPHAPNKLSFTGVLDNEPLELEYLHTVLAQNGYDDYIFDAMVEYVDFNDILKRETPDIVCITGYITQENLMLKYAKLTKEYNPKVTTVLGGVHVQLNHDRFAYNYIDYLSRSECMNAFIDLIKHIDPNQTSIPIEEINGAGYRLPAIEYNSQNTKIDFIINELKPTDINSLPIPDRSFFNKHKKNFRYLELTEIATMKTSFSCPFDCNFCYCTLLGKGKYMTRDLDLVIEEIKGIQSDNIQIVDDDFMVDRNRLIEFARLIKENNIKKNYTIYARADFMAKNPDMVELMAEIGVRYFLVGLEAINDKALKSMNKRTTNEINRKCIESTKNTKADCIGLFIVNIDATPQDFKDLIVWVKDTGINHVTVSMFTPIPGTPLYEEYKDKLITDNIEEWDFLHLVLQPTNMSKRKFYWEYYKMFMELYKISKKTGIYDFMNAKYYKNMVTNYLKVRIIKN